MHFPDATKSHGNKLGIIVDQLSLQEIKILNHPKNMAKIVRCREVGVDCDFEVRGETEHEVLDKCAQHLRTAHAGTSPELVEKVRAAIREEPETQAGGAYFSTEEVRIPALAQRQNFGPAS